MEDLICGDCEPSKKPVVENIGLEFMEWAEKGWLLDKIIQKGFAEISGDGSESCPYQYMKDIFIKKINELAENKYVEEI